MVVLPSCACCLQLILIEGLTQPESDKAIMLLFNVVQAGDLLASSPAKCRMLRWAAATGPSTPRVGFTRPTSRGQSRGVMVVLIFAAAHDDQILPGARVVGAAAHRARCFETPDVP